MNPLIFKFVLPMLLGYTLFVGLSGRFSVFGRPADAQARPAWFLGLWVGGCTTLLLSLGLHMADRLPVERVPELLTPAAMLYALALLPGLVGYVMYRRTVRDAEHRQQLDDMDLDDMDRIADRIAASLDTDLDERLISAELDVDTKDTLATDLHDELAEPVAALSAAIDDSNDTQASNDTEHDDATPLAAIDSVDADTRKTEFQLREQLQQETSLREELEKHLRVTRKALSTLEAESREFESSKADALMELENALDARIRQTSAAEALAARENAARVGLETDIVGLKQDLLEARREIRRSTAARAQVLGSANKAIALARQTMQARKRAEAKLKEAQASLDSRQETISSLIAALEKEKRRNQEDVAKLARQLVRQELEAQSQRKLDAAANQAEQRITSRLVKKVAKARPTQTS